MPELDATLATVPGLYDTRLTVTVHVSDGRARLHLMAWPRDDRDPILVPMLDAHELRQALADAQRLLDATRAEPEFRYRQPARGFVMRLLAGLGVVVLALGCGGNVATTEPACPTECESACVLAGADSGYCAWSPERDREWCFCELRDGVVFALPSRFAH